MENFTKFIPETNNAILHELAKSRVIKKREREREKKGKGGLLFC